MKMTLPLSLGAAVALCLGYLHLVPAPQGECATGASTTALHATSEATSEIKTACCEGGTCCREGSCCTQASACCQEGAACCVASAQTGEIANCCPAGGTCPQGSTCCAASGCACQLTSMPTACEQSVREAMIIAGDLGRFVDQEISAVLPLVNTESQILQTNFLETNDGFGTLPSPLQPCDGILPQSRDE